MKVCLTDFTDFTKDILTRFKKRKSVFFRLSWEININIPGMFLKSEVKVWTNRLPRNAATIFDSASVAELIFLN